MPRIRTLKPEHKQHRKVGMLTDREYRLWVGMITEADDEGRLVADAAWLRGVIFTYQPRVTITQVSDALVALSKTGLVKLYTVEDTRYAQFPSWTDHQRINRPSPSKLPTCPNEIPFTEGSLRAHAGSERIGKDLNPPKAPPRSAASLGNRRSVASQAAGFEEFYALYPRKKAPDAARRAWTSAVKQTTPDVIIAALKRELPEFSKRPADRVPYPATWLNGGHWRSEPDKNTSASLYDSPEWPYAWDCAKCGGVHESLGPPPEPKPCPKEPSP